MSKGLANLEEAERRRKNFESKTRQDERCLHQLFLSLRYGKYVSSICTHLTVRPLAMQTDETHGPECCAMSSNKETSRLERQDQYLLVEGETMAAEYLVNLKAAHADYIRKAS